MAIERMPAKREPSQTPPCGSVSIDPGVMGSPATISENRSARCSGFGVASKRSTLIGGA